MIFKYKEKSPENNKIEIKHSLIIDRVDFLWIVVVVSVKTAINKI